MTKTNIDIRDAESNVNYHAGDGHLSHSMLETFYDSPQLYKGQYVTGEWQREETAAMRRGSIVHALVLEPGTIATRYRTLPFIDRRTKKWKKASAAAMEEGYTPLTEMEAREADSIANRVVLHPLAKKIFAACMASHREVSIRWTDGGVNKKARLDLFCKEAEIEFMRDGKRLTYEGPVVIDLKTADKPWPDKFRWAVRDFGYDRQAAWYVDAAVAAWQVLPIFLFIVVGTSQPHDVYVYEMATERIEQARVTNTGIVKLLTECRESGNYTRVKEMEILTVE